MGFLVVFAALVEASQAEQARQASLRQAQEDEQKRQQQEQRDLQQAIIASQSEEDGEALQRALIQSLGDSTLTPKSRSWWHWLALFLFAACALACTTALVFGAISLAAHAAFWVVPAAVAGPVVLISAFALLLLLLVGLRYSSSPSKSLGGGSSSELLLPAGSPSDARPASLDASASAVDRRVLSAGHGHTMSVATRQRSLFS